MLALSSSATARLSTLPSTKTLEGSLSKREELNDEALIAGIAVGEREALSRLFRRFARPIRGVGRRILRNDADADDLVQEVFLYIHRKSALFDRSKSSARSWIFQIAYTQAFIRRRQQKSRGFYASAIADKLHGIECWSTSGADYDKSVEAFFGKNGWRRMLDALSTEQRETLKLHFFEGYTFAEIAEKLGESYANIRNHHYRGLEKLRKHLSETELNRRQAVPSRQKSDGESRRVTNGPS